MRDPQTISRASVKSDESAFAALKERGIALAQQISGDNWSDYNTHDPGVTILEQLCYALTELTFHADFDVADLLLNDDGVLDYRAQSLHRPEEIFPCRPTTVADLRKALLDEVREINNVWLSTAVDGGGGAAQPSGLYYAQVRRDTDCDISNERLVEKVIRAFNRHRNLSEDLASVTVLKDKKCTLHAKIEVDGCQQADELLAELYFRCGDYISGNVPLSSYLAAVKEGVPLEQLFNGPLTRHGLFDLSADDAEEEIVVPTLFSIINSITGVDHIKGLHLVLGGRKIYEVVARRYDGDVVSLELPVTAAEVKVELFRNGAALPVSIEAVRRRYQEIAFRRDSMREVEQDFSALYSLPSGVVRGAGRYTSIQQQFPAIYGINHFGVNGESAAAQARANQLKSYLLLFEQLMANHSATTAQLDKLYSVEDERRQTYDYQVIDETMVSGVELLYPEQPAEAIAAILARYDNYFERKGRVLDYLLALYGQKFTQNTLRYFNYYYQGDELNEVIIKNKIASLGAIIKFDRDRAAGYNALAPGWNTTNISGLQFKLAILLGFRHMASRSLTLPLTKQGLKVIAHEDYRTMSHGSRELKMVSLNDIGEHFSEAFYPVSCQPLDEFEAVIEVSENLDTFVPLKNNAISDALLQGGVSLERFKVGSLVADDGYQMVFNLPEERDWWYVGRADTREAGDHHIRLLHRFLIHLNIESEGLHLVEHLLLRPLCSSRQHDLPGIDPLTFYSARITVLFPDWTARCQDPRFRALAEESVRNNAPAHLYADIYWLDFDAMCRFELLYKGWLDARMAADLAQMQRGGAAAAEIDGAAEALVKFLYEQRRDGDE